MYTEMQRIDSMLVPAQTSNKKNKIKKGNDADEDH